MLIGLLNKIYLMCILCTFNVHLNNKANMKEISQANLSSILKHISSLQQQSLLRKFCQTSNKPETMFNLGHSERKHF